MSRIDYLLAEQCPEGVDFRPLRDVGVWAGGGTPSKANANFWTGGDIPWLSPKDMGPYVLSDTLDHVTQEAVQGSATKIVQADAIAVVVRSSILDRILPTTRLGAPMAMNQDMRAVEVHPDVVPGFLAHLLRDRGPAILRAARKTGGSVASIDVPRLMKFRVPVPPVEVQREIVAILDTFTELEAELEAELAARQQQYKYYQDIFLTLPRQEIAWMTLGDLGKVSMCKRVFKEETSVQGDIPFYKIGTFGNTPDAFISRELYEAYRSRYSFPKRGDVLISAAGTIGRVIPYDGEPAYFQDSNIVWIDNDESIVLNSYLRYWYRVVEWATDGGTIQRLYNENIRRARIAVPTLAEQKRIVDALDQFDALVSSLRVGLPAELAARRKQYEYYRDRLLTFEEAVA